MSWIHGEPNPLNPNLRDQLQPSSDKVQYKHLETGRVLSTRDKIGLNLSDLEISYINFSDILQITASILPVISMTMSRTDIMVCRRLLGYSYGWTFKYRISGDRPRSKETTPKLVLQNGSQVCAHRTPHYIRQCRHVSSPAQVLGNLKTFFVHVLDLPVLTN